MKKIIYSIIFLMSALSSCKKETLSKSDPKLDVDVTALSSGRTILPPKNVDTLGVFTFSTGSLVEPFVTNAKILLSKGGAFSPTDDTRNLFFTIATKNGAVFYQSEKKVAVGETNIFSYLARALESNKSYTIMLYADVLSSATDGVDPEDATVVTLELAYIGKGEATPSVLRAVGQKTVFSTTPVVPTFSMSSVATINPSSAVVLEGQQKPVLSYGVKAMGTPGEITEHVLIVQGAAATAVAALKVFEGATLVGQASVVNVIATIPGNTMVLKDSTKTFVVQASISGVTSSTSNEDFTVTLDKVTAKSTVSGLLVSDNTDRSGNSFRVFKATPTVVKRTVPTVTITNTSMELYGFDVTAPTGSIAQKQFAFEVVLNDQGANDTLSLKNFKIFEGGVDVTSLYRITDANGVVDTLFTEGDTKLICTRTAGSGETVVAAGTIKTFVFKATVSGFNHPLDGDGMSVRLLEDNTSSVGLKYVNSGGAANSCSRLASIASGTSGAILFYYQWSDISAASHSGQIGLSSNDWAGGEKVFSPLSANIFHQ